MSTKVINVNRKQIEDPEVFPNEIHSPKFGNAATTAMHSATPQRPKKIDKKKKFFSCSRISRPEKSIDKFMTNEKMMQIAISMYPSKTFGHIDCIIEPIKTPKTMGWLWSVEETGGVKVRNGIYKFTQKKKIMLILTYECFQFTSPEKCFRTFMNL